MADVLASSFALLSLHSPPSALSSSSSSSFTATRLYVKQPQPWLCLTKSLKTPNIRASAALAASPSALTADPDNLEAFVKAALPGGLAAQRLLGTGRRKCAIARVVLVEGTGKIIINCRTAQDYLQGNPLWLHSVKFPLVSLGYEHKYDVIAKAHGGGLSAQAQAILLGISRALVVANQANRDPLKKQGLLTRDPRKVERKKYGLKKARKAPQYSKR